MNHVTMYLVDTKEDFRGFYEKMVTVYDDMTTVVSNTNGLNLEAYTKLNTAHASYVLVSDEELTEKLAAYNDSLITQPEEIDRDRFLEMLEVLPPCKWTKGLAWESFHISERLTNNLVSWFLNDGDKYYEFVDEATLSTNDIGKKMRKMI